jgi:hypothetical protein
MATTAALTEEEQRALEQMREAQAQGSTLKEHAAKMGLDVQQVYELRRRLVRKGAFEPRPRRKTRKSDKAGAFLSVRVVPSAPAASSALIRCRLVHPHGWVLECDGLPPASWMSVVLAGGNHAAP